MKKVFPDVYLYNPTCDFAIANGSPHWQPNRLLQQMEQDMAVLPLFFAQPADVVVVHELPSAGFLKSLQPLVPNLPRFVQRSGLNSLVGQSLNKLWPWGWSPAAHRLLEPLKAFCSPDFRQSPVFKWSNEHRMFYSRSFALNVLIQTEKELGAGYVISPHQFPVICQTQAEIEACLKKWGFIMAKAPWSSSGRGLQPVTKAPVHPKVWEKLQGIINDQGFVMIEPLLHKQMDLALEFVLENGKIRFLGTSYFETDKKGSYQGNFLGGMPANGISGLARFVLTHTNNIVAALIKVLELTRLCEIYEGCFGVDLLVFSDEQGRLKINPCLEINLRYNMGLLALKLEKFIAGGMNGVFRTYYNSQKTFTQFCAEMEKCYPLHIADGKIKSGFWALTDCKESTRFGAYVLV